MNNISNNNFTATTELVDLYRSNRDLYFEDCPALMNNLRDEAIEKFQEQGIPWRKMEITNTPT
jgi:hypothetical protein